MSTVKVKEAASAVATESGSGPQISGMYLGMTDGDFTKYAVENVATVCDQKNEFPEIFGEFNKELEARVKKLRNKLFDIISSPGFLKLSQKQKAKKMLKIQEFLYLMDLTNKVLVRTFREMPDESFVGWGKRNYIDGNGLKDSPDKRAFNGEAAVRYRLSMNETKLDGLWRGIHEEIGELVVLQTQSFARKKLNERNSSWGKYKQNSDDMYGTAVLEILRRFPDYRRKYSLSTFCTMLVLGADTQYKAQERQITMHQQEMTSKVRREIKKLTDMGLDPDDIVVDDLVPRLPDMSEKTILNCLELIRQSTVEWSTDLIDQTTGADNEFSNPLTKTLQQATKKELDELLSKLLSHERMAIKLAYGYFDETTGYFNKKISNKWIARHRGFLNEVCQHNESLLIRINEEDGKAEIERELNKGTNPMTKEEALFFSTKFAVRENYVSTLLQRAMTKIHGTPEFKDKSRLKDDSTSYGAHLNYDGYQQAMETMEILENM